MKVETLDLYARSTPESLSFLFKLTMWWRILYGVLRIILGASFIRHHEQLLSDFIYNLLAHEITGRTTDAVLEYFYNLFQVHEFTITYFIAFYFIFWGTVDIILSLCLLKHIKTAFPITMGLIVLFICYSVFRLTFTHSLVLLSVIVMDLIILYLINTEYKKLKAETVATESDPI